MPTWMERATGIVASPESDQPDSGRLSLDDYMAMLSRSMGELATHQAAIERAIAQAVPRYAEVVFLPDEVDTPPTGALHRVKPIPPGDWRSMMLLCTSGLMGSLPSVIFIDDLAFTPINSQSPIVFPLYGSVKTVSLAATGVIANTGRFIVAFSNRELYVRT